jgi:hypothetical protein
VTTPIPLTEAAALSLARAASLVSEAACRGGRLWVFAPDLDDHARHLAVEFVHPASVGARAVAATAVTGPAPLDAIRRHVRGGDVIVSLGDAAHPDVIGCSLRSSAWGSGHVHIGWLPGHTPGGHPPLQPTTTLIAIGDGSSAESSVTRAYHLLWELTFVAIGGTGDAPTVGSEMTASCPVCADEALVAEVEEILDADHVRARTACGVVIVDTSLVDTLRAYDVVLVHAGVALRTLSIGDRP